MADRYYHADLPARGRISLDADVARHLAQVMRIRVGGEIVLFDGMGSEADAIVTRVGRRDVEVEVQDHRVRPPDAGRHIELAWSPPRGARASALLEHGTELGVRAFRPIVTARTPPAARAPNPRWQRVVIAAAGQCGSSRLPVLHDPVPFAEFVATVVDRFDGERWVAASSTPNPPADGPPPARALVVVGPEGGFTDAEQGALAACGCAPLDLGPNVLRTETAALAAVALLRLAPPSWPGP